MRGLVSVSLAETGAACCQRADNDLFVTAAVAHRPLRTEKDVVDPYRVPLSEFLDRNPAALRDAPAVLTPVVRALVNRLAGDLVGVGLVDDVVSQTFMMLLLPTARHFDPTRGSAARYLYGVVLHATAEIRVQHGAAGIRRNDRRLRLVQDERDSMRSLRRQREPRYEDAADAVCLRVYVERALGGAPLDLRTAAALLGEHDQNMTEAAEAVRLDRNTLRRRLRAWAATARLPA